MRFLSTVGLITLLFTVTPAFSQPYEVDPAHSSLSFSVEHLGLTEVDGHFNEFSGRLDVTPGEHGGSVEFTAQAASIDTSVAKRDEHLRTADFFDVAKFPTLNFKSTKVTHLSHNRYQIDGDLTVHGVTKPVTTTARILGPKEAMGAQKIGFRTTFKINRIDYGVGAGDKFSSDSMIGHDIYIEVKGEAAQVETK